MKLVMTTALIKQPATEWFRVVLYQDPEDSVTPWVVWYEVHPEPRRSYHRSSYRVDGGYHETFHNAADDFAARVQRTSRQTWTEIRNISILMWGDDYTTIRKTD